MKTIDEIRARLNDLLAEYNDIKEWHEKASKKYANDRRFFGRDVDSGEMDYAYGELLKCGHKIHLLKWVLDEEEKNHSSE